jgi:hypothetical protein
MQHSEPDFSLEWRVRMSNAGLPVADVVVALLPRSEKYSDTLAALIRKGQPAIHILEVMLSLATSGAAHYGGCREMARVLRQVAEECDRWAAAEEKEATY